MSWPFMAETAASKAMARKTDLQITEEVAKLRELQTEVRRFSAFGDDNRAALEAAAEVLDERMSLDEVHGRFGEEVLDTALRAHDWMAGQLAENEPAVSEEGWPLAA